MTWLLIADDNDDLRETLAKALREHGYIVQTAADGAAVVRMLDLADSLPALVLLDLLMPNLTGRAVLHGMRSLARTRDVPVVVLTGVDAEGWGLGGVRRGRHPAQARLGRSSDCAHPARSGHGQVKPTPREVRGSLPVPRSASTGSEGSRRLADVRRATYGLA